MKRPGNKAAVVFALALGAALAIGAWWLRPGLLTPETPRPNIVVVLVDTLRADHLGTYGYDRDTSPAIDALARRASVFTSAYSVSNWTNPAIKSMFTGRSPQAVMEEATHAEAIRIPLPPSVTTFAELAQEHGYRTAALVDHPGIKPWGNFDQGFERYTMLYEEGAAGRGAWGKSDIEYVAGQFGERLDEYGDEPFLIWLHVVYPHRPYHPPDAYAGTFGPDDYEEYEPAAREPIVSAYDAEIRRTDDLVARLEDALAARGRLQDTWILLTSDHGEGFWEHGFAEHGNAFYDEAIRVPLILVPPLGHQGTAGRVATPVSNLDVFATVAGIAGIVVPENTEGVSLVDGGPAASDRPRALFSESAHSYDIHARTILRGGFKYTHYPSRPEDQRYFLFDLTADPGERDNLYGTRPELQTDLRALLEAHRARAATELATLTQTVVEPDPETLEALRALGYIR